MPVVPMLRSPGAGRTRDFGFHATAYRPRAVMTSTATSGSASSGLTLVRLPWMKPQDVLIVETSDARAHFGFWDGGYLVHHQTADGAQSVSLVRRHRQSEQ